ncbi:MAG: enoyl-CoA hydratase/isomerase family protein [Xanthomonadales bacterium]|nr:enoyl-CoA hydratase/isomerase family protein [Xanthomonadales bacterium]
MLNRNTHDTVLELNMARPPVNALNAELVQALHAQIDSAMADGFEAIVISGQPEIFSAGLDVPELMSFRRPQMIEFWIEFMSLLRCIALSPIPIVAAITGHSPAGGAVIALPCDYRIMAQSSKKGRYKIGLNEVQVGLVIPPVIYNSLVRLTGARIAGQLAVEGLLIDADTALAYGLVDELQETKDVVAAALNWCQRHLALPRHAMLKTRAIARHPLVDAYSSDDYFKINDFVDHWFHDSTQTVLQMLVEQLGKR